MKTLSTVVGVLVLAVALGAPTPAGASEPQQDQSPQKRRPVATNLESFEQLPREELERRTTVVAATRGLKPPPPVPLAPWLGLAYSTRPTLAWDSRIAEVSLVVRDATGAELLRREISGERFSWDDAPPLQEGESYTWTVRSKAGESEPASFALLSGDQRAAVATELGAAARADDEELARARTLARHAIWYDCLAAYTALIERQPQRPELYEERASVLAQVERTRAAAQADGDRARALR